MVLLWLTTIEVVFESGSRAAPPHELLRLLLNAIGVVLYEKLVPGCMYEHADFESISNTSREFDSPIQRLPPIDASVLAPTRGTISSDISVHGSMGDELITLDIIDIEED